MHTGHNAAEAACGAHVGERNGSKAKNTMPCAADKCPTRGRRIPARCQQRLSTVQGAWVCGGRGWGGMYAVSPSPAAPLTDALGVVRGAVVGPNLRQSGDGAAGRQGGRRAAAGGRGRRGKRGGRGQGRTRGGEGRDSRGQRRRALAPRGGTGGSPRQLGAQPGRERQVRHICGRQHCQGVGGGRGGGGEDGGGRGRESADSAQCAGCSHELDPPGRSERKQRQRWVRVARDWSDRPQEHRWTHRRTGAAKHGRAGTGELARGKEDRRAPGEEQEEKESATGTNGHSPSSCLQQPPSGSPPQVGAALRADEKTEARRQETARYKALAHLEDQRRRRQAPSPEPKTVYRLEVGRGGAENIGKQKRAR